MKVQPLYYNRANIINFSQKRKITDTKTFDTSEVRVIKPDDVHISDEEKELLIEKIIEAHKLAKKNYDWGNISKRGYATNVGLENGMWHLATNFNNTRNSVSAVCGERSAILGAYNDLLKSKASDEAIGRPLDFKVKYLAMSSYLPLGEDSNAANSCAECLSWFDTPRYFSDDTLIASIQNSKTDSKPCLVISKVSDYLPNRSCKVELPAKSIDTLPINMSENARISAKEKGITDEIIREQVKMTADRYKQNTMSDVSGQNIAASVYANGNFYFGQKTDFSKRWYIEPLEFAFGKAVEENGKETKVDSICYIGDETIPLKSSMSAPDRVINVKVLGELSTRFANPKTLVVSTKEDEISVKTIGDYMPDRFKFIQGYKI